MPQPDSDKICIIEKCEQPRYLEQKYCASHWGSHSIRVLIPIPASPGADPAARLVRDDPTDV